VACVASTLVAACAAPSRYQSVKRYAPPQDAAAPACLAQCTTVIRTCQHECADGYQACINGVGPEANSRYAAAQRQYEAALNAYRAELDRYRLDLMFGWGSAPYWGYGPYWGGWAWYPPFPPPAPPPAPSVEQETARLIAERCDRDCGCQTAYDACFLGCGGTIQHETACVANCPPAKSER
jgi:hypothetical protein